MDNIYFRCLNGLGDKLLDAIGVYVFCKVLGCHATIDLNGDVRNSWFENLWSSCKISNIFDEFADMVRGLTYAHQMFVGMADADRVLQ